MKRQNIHRQSGFSLIELMIALAINLVIVAAAAYLYLGTSESKRALSQQQQLSENGQYALDLIGKDITNSGFYPSAREIIGGLNAKSYASDTISQSQAAFNYGIFGCSGQSFSPSTKACVAHAGSSVTADTIVVNYFTNDAMGSDIGQRVDCNRSDVDGASENGGRTDASTSATLGQVPLKPLFVSNRYTLVTTTYSIEGQNISTQSLACNGNVNTVYQPAIVGIESLQFLYGVYSDDTLQPQRFYAASAVAGLGGTVDTKLPQAPWARVVSVEVCLVARGLEASKLTTSTGTVTPYVNCAGVSVTPPDRFVRKVYRKTFALRNNLSQTIRPVL
jgi:type IV pilus assembly protein PilW